jgi:hypothetical protein
VKSYGTGRWYKMKIVINKCFGGFSVNDNIVKMLNLESRYDLEDDRTNARLIELIESGEDVNGDYSNLTVVEIPDDATDYIIDEYDGYENVLYVLDGKIKRV